MSRRRINPLDEMVDRMARLPWWAGVVAALLSWILFYGVARLALPVQYDAGSTLQGVAVPVLHGLAMAGQFVLPLLFLTVAALSAWLHYRHDRNYADMNSERGRFLLQHLSWREFENLVAEFFRRKGFSVEQRGRKASDGGVDLVARIGEDRYLVQCKHWRVQRVGVTVVRELCQAAEAEGAAGVFVVTSGSFTDEARQFVQKNRIAIELITGDGLRQMIRGLDTQPQ